jgi:hypothetical protein
LGDKGAYRVFVVKPEGKSHLEYRSIGGNIILRWVFSKWDVGVWNGLIWIKIVTVGGRL